MPCFFFWRYVWKEEGAKKARSKKTVHDAFACRLLMLRARVVSREERRIRRIECHKRGGLHMYFTTGYLKFGFILFSHILSRSHNNNFMKVLCIAMILKSQVHGT